MKKRVAFIHTYAGHATTFNALAAELMPDVEVYNVVDESLLQNTIRAGTLQPETSKRLARLIESAEEAGADAVLVTCSSMGPAIEASRPFVRIPVLRVDQPMVDEALSIGRKIGVAATLSTTLEPTVDLARARAEALERSDVEIITRLVEGAFEAVMSGDTAKHDEWVTAGLIDLASQADVIILAQASMARVAANLPVDTIRVPILSSPRSGLQAVADALKANP